MAGRGCNISLVVYSDNGVMSSTLSLPVALHSPLIILQQQLEETTGISKENQVLILCDLSDLERNNDILLTGKENWTLSQIGIKKNSTLTLHPLGIQSKITRSCKQLKEQVAKADNSVVLSTRITPAQANHAYNGVIFDVFSKGPHEITISSISVGGMLGPVTIFARDSPWEEGKIEHGPSPHWWAHTESLSRSGWHQIAKLNCSPAWDKCFEIKFQTPVVLQPYMRRGLYVHSSLPNDLGIQYQSYSKEDIIAEDDCLQLLPGLGHTGSRPFDETQGWYRAWRGLAGSVRYTSVLKGWRPDTHRVFPDELRLAVRVLLLCNAKGPEAEGKSAVRRTELQLSDVPLHVLYYTMEFMHWDWYKGVDMSVFNAAQKPPADSRQTSGLVHAGSVEGSATRSALASYMLMALNSHYGHSSYVDAVFEDEDEDEEWMDDEEGEEEDVEVEVEEEDEEEEWADEDNDLCEAEADEEGDKH